MSSWCQLMSTKAHFFWSTTEPSRTRLGGGLWWAAPWKRRTRGWTGGELSRARGALEHSFPQSWWGGFNQKFWNIQVTVLNLGSRIVSIGTLCDVFLYPDIAGLENNSSFFSACAFSTFANRGWRSRWPWGKTTNTVLKKQRLGRSRALFSSIIQLGKETYT